MEYNLKINIRATFEIQDSYNYYQLKSSGLARRFLKTVEEYLEKIKQNPKHFQIKRAEIRKAYLRKFPFIIVYEIVNDTIIIYSVFHTNRNPTEKK